VGTRALVSAALLGDEVGHLGVCSASDLLGPGYSSLLILLGIESFSGLGRSDEARRLGHPERRCRRIFLEVIRSDRMRGGTDEGASKADRVSVCFVKRT